MVDLDDGGAQDMAGRGQLDAATARQVRGRVEVDRPQGRSRAARRRRCTAAAPAGDGTVRAGSGSRRRLPADGRYPATAGGTGPAWRASKGSAPKSIPHQPGQVAGMVQVRVRQHHRVDIRWRHGKRRPVAQPQRLHALEQAAIEQDAASAGFQQMARAGHQPAAPRKRRVGEMGMDPPLSGFQLRMRRRARRAGRTGA